MSSREHIVLKKHNIYEVAKKTGRDPQELELLYYAAQRKNEVWVFTIEIKEARMPRQEAQADYGHREDGD